MTRHLYQILLNLYPRAYRESFAGEMMDVFTRRLHEAQALGSFTVFWFAVTEIAGVLSGAVSECITASARRIPDSLPGLTVPASDELSVAERKTALLTGKLVRAIARHQFAEARLFAAEEVKARAAVEQIQTRLHASTKTT